MPRKRRKNSRPKYSHQPYKPEPMGGDHGPDTAAARAGKRMRPVKDDANGRGQLVVVWHVDEMLMQGKLTMRQWQAAEYIWRTHAMLEKLSSGGPLKERVDASPKPDAFTAAQADAMTKFRRGKDPIPVNAWPAVESVCCHNRKPSQWVEGLLADALDRAADAIGA